MISDEQDHLDSLAAWAEYVHSEKNARIAEAMSAIDEIERERFVRDPSKEMEDMQLVSRLRELADRIEARWT